MNVSGCCLTRRSILYHTFCPFGACLEESPGSPFCPWVSETNKRLPFVTILETVIHQSAQSSNKFTDESASCF